MNLNLLLSNVKEASQIELFSLIQFSIKQNTDYYYK